MAGLPVPSVVAGGTPTFPIHARRPDVECSPGTSVFWDWSYSTILPDLDFLPAVLLLTRIVSKPGENRLCLDLGHKAVASENPPPRVIAHGAAGHDGRRPQRGTPRARNGSRRRVFSRLAFLRHAVAHLSRRWRSTTRPWSSRTGGRSGDGRSSAARAKITHLNLGSDLGLTPVPPAPTPSWP